MKKSIDKKSKKKADFATSAINNALKKQGLDIGMGADNTIHNVEQLKKEINTKEKVEIALSRLITDSIRGFNIDTILNKEVLKHKLICNVTIGKIVVNGNDAYISEVHPSCFNFIGKPNAKNDSDIDAIQVVEYIRITDAIIKYSSLKNVSNGNIDYYDCYCAIKNNKGKKRLDRDEAILENYYNLLRDGGFSFDGENVYAEEKELYFNIIKPVYAKLYLNNKRLNKDETAKYIDGTHEMYDLVDVVEADKNDYDVKSEKAELWRSICIGNSSIPLLAKYHTQLKSKFNPNNIQFPFIIEINEEPSLLDVGKELCNMYSSIMRILDTEICIGGGKILNIDMDYKPENMSNEEYIALVQHKKINAYTGSGIKGKQQQYDYKHLSSTDMGIGDDIIRLIDLSTIIRNTYKSLIGIGYDNLLIQRQGEKKSEGEGKNFIAENSIAYLILDEHNKFIAKCIDKLKNFGWGKWIKNANKLSRCGIINANDVDEIKDYHAVDDIGIYITSSISDQFYANQVKGHLRALAATSGIGLEEVIKLSGIKNEREALKMYNDGFGSMKRVLDNQNNLIKENEALKQQLEQAKLLPLQIADLKGQYAIKLKEMDIEKDLSKTQMNNDFKGQKVDVENNNQALMQERLFQLQNNMNNENTA